MLLFLFFILWSVIGFVVGLVLKIVFRILPIKTIIVLCLAGYCINMLAHRFLS